MNISVLILTLNEDINLAAELDHDGEQSAARLNRYQSVGCCGRDLGHVGIIDGAARHVAGCSVREVSCHQKLLLGGALHDKLCGRDGHSDQFDVVCSRSRCTLVNPVAEDQIIGRVDFQSLTAAVGNAAGGLDQ